MKDLLEDFPAEKLSRAEENALAKRIRKGYQSALNKLVLHTMREAVTYAAYCSHNEIPQSDLISSCYESLVRSAKKFKPGYSRFMAYCKPAIRGDLKRVWTRKKVVRNASTIPMDEVHTTITPKPGVTTEPEDQSHIEAELGQTVEPDFQSIFTKERWELVKGIIAEVCTERERTILDLMYRGGLSAAEVARMDNLSRERIRQIHGEALKKVRCALMEKRRLFND